MAELVFSRVGAAIGSRLAPAAFRAIGAALGRAAGAYIGGRIDQAVFGEDQHEEGRRLADLHIQGSTEGAAIPAVYGRCRIAGQVIWAAKFNEHAQTRESGGGKGGGGARTTTYRYTLSFAVGLCEGPVRRIARAWANGEPLDLSSVSWRLHSGAEDQAADPLIEAVEGGESAPAYRGLAYVVFEDLPLDAYGATLPQLSFEIVRSPPAADAAPRLEDRVEGVCLIPGAGEFVYATDIVRRKIAAGEEIAENAHAAAERANLLVSLDQLQADLPNCASVMLVVAWFGTDLRCGECAIKPGVEAFEKATRPLAWRVNGLSRGDAHLISTVDGAPAFGGTPSDNTVLQAIAELKQRGLRVGLYPFVLMDVPADNALADPYGGATQAAYPWRGRITCHPAAGEPGSPDKTGAAVAQVESFFGEATGADFTVSDGAPAYEGPSEWSFRRFILHYAKLAAMAGGVDAFVLGSELRGLTRVRGEDNAYPAVGALCELAADVREIIGEDAALTYAADWSEYFGHQPQDGSGDVFFHLDPLWSHEAISAVGVDWYAPLSDWRAGTAHLDAQLAPGVHDLDYLEGRIEAGEHYDYFYASEADRHDQSRTPIADGAYSKPWVFRPKALRAWWENEHFNRPGGVEAAEPTAWEPQSKPFWIVELGAPAVDKGANAPNLFIDPKSAESALPPYSTGAPDDLIQRRVLEAYLRHWQEGAAANPTSTDYLRPMIAPEGVHVWAWDARPHPQFPARTDVWSDGGAWRLGHWLNGRAGTAPLGDVVFDLCRRAGVADADVSGLSGMVTGYAADSPATARAALEPLMGIYDFDARESGGVLRFAHRTLTASATLTLDDVAIEPDGRIAIARADGADAPVEARLRFLDAARDHRLSSAYARNREAAGAGVLTIDAPLALGADAAEAVAQRLLATALGETETLSVSLPPSALAIEPGDRLTLDAPGASGAFRVRRIEEGLVRRAELARDLDPAPLLVSAPTPNAPSLPGPPSAPDLLILDLPPLPGAETDERPLAAVRASPWPGAIDIFAGGDAGGATLRAIAERPAIMGELIWDLWPGPVGRWDDGNAVRVTLRGGGAESLSDAALLAGGNAFAVERAGGAWEIIQAREATLVAPNTFDLRGLLRGQQGTEGAMAAPVAAGARIVKLDQRLARLEMQAHEIGETLVWGAAASGRTLADPAATTLSAPWEKIWARPFSPVHVRGRREADGAISLSWVRRARLGGDSWGVSDVPLGETSEAYRVEILSGATVIRTLETAGPAVSYPEADQIADFGAPPSALTVRIAQVSQSFGPGALRESTIWL